MRVWPRLYASNSFVCFRLPLHGRPQGTGCLPAHCHLDVDNTFSQYSQIGTPLIAPAWEEALAAHPDQSFARYICNGIKYGFRIGFDYAQAEALLKSHKRNMPSARGSPRISGLRGDDG